MAKSAKPTNAFDVTGIIADKQNKKQNTQHTTQIHNTQVEYSFNQEETRSKRIQIVIKPSTNSRIDELVKKGVVKSKNDLINVLLENFLDQAEQPVAGGEVKGQMSIDDVE